MPLPLIPIALATMLGGLAVSGGANLYSQYNQRKLWEDQATAYEHLDKGYRDYLARQGRQINPDRAWTSYYGQARMLRSNIANSYAHSVGTVGGTIGAMAGFSRSGGLFDNSSHRTRRWL